MEVVGRANWRLVALSTLSVGAVRPGGLMTPTPLSILSTALDVKLASVSIRGQYARPARSVSGGLFASIARFAALRPARMLAGRVNSTAGPDVMPLPVPTPAPLMVRDLPLNVVGTMLVWGRVDALSAALCVVSAASSLYLGSTTGLPNLLLSRAAMLALVADFEDCSIAWLLRLAFLAIGLACRAVSFSAPMDVLSLLLNASLG